MSVFGGVGFVGAELVKIVERGGLVEGGLRVGNGVFAGDGGEIGRGLDGGRGVGEAAEIARCDGACSEGGGSGEEAAAVLLVLLEDVLRSDVRGADDGLPADGAAEKHLRDFPSLGQRDGLMIGLPGLPLVRIRLGEACG